MKRTNADETMAGRNPNVDLYQLTTYTIATGLPSGLLIYADGQDATPSDRALNLTIQRSWIATPRGQLSGAPEASPARPLGAARSTARS